MASVSVLCECIKDVDDYTFANQYYRFIVGENHFVYVNGTRVTRAFFNSHFKILTSNEITELRISNYNTLRFINANKSSATRNSS